MHGCGESTAVAAHQQALTCGTGDPCVLKHTLALPPGMGSPGRSLSYHSDFLVDLCCLRRRESRSLRARPRAQLQSVHPTVPKTASPEVLKPPYTHSVQKGLHLPC